MAGKEARKPKRKNPNEQKMAMKAYKRAVSNKPKARKKTKDVRNVARLQAKPMKEKKATGATQMQRSQGTMQQMQRTQRSYDPHVDMKVRDNVANVTYPVVNGVSRKTTGKEVKGSLRKRYYTAD